MEEINSKMARGVDDPMPVAVVQAADVASLTSASGGGHVKRGISVTNKTEQNSSSLVLTIGENFITQW